MPLYVATVLSTLCIFSLTFYVGKVYQKWFSRFNHDTGVHSNLPHLCGVATGTVPKQEATKVIRYANEIVHFIFYADTDRGIDVFRWNNLIAWGYSTVLSVSRCSDKELLPWSYTLGPSRQ